jgi:hypothetical protein
MRFRQYVYKIDNTQCKNKKELPEEFSRKTFIDTLKFNLPELKMSVSNFYQKVKLIENLLQED